MYSSARWKNSLSVSDGIGRSYGPRSIFDVNQYPAAAAKSQPRRQFTFPRWFPEIGDPL
jgi:hypothetical protein